MGIDILKTLENHDHGTMITMRSILKQYILSMLSDPQTVIVGPKRIRGDQKFNLLASGLGTISSKWSVHMMRLG